MFRLPVRAKRSPETAINGAHPKSQTSRDSKNIMKTYKIFEKGGQKVAIKQGWSWPAFFFQWIWAFIKKLMLPGFVCLGIGFACAVIGMVTGVKNLINPCTLIMGVVFGLKGNKWREGQLVKSGYSDMGTVQAKNPAEAVSSNPKRPEFPSINAPSEVAGSFSLGRPEK